MELVAHGFESGHPRGQRWAIEEFWTLPQYRELTDFWIDHPPTDYLMAGFVGYKPARSFDEAVEAAELAPEDRAFLDKFRKRKRAPAPKGDHVQ